MPEKRFITSIFIEGMILTVLGLCILIIPKLTALSYGVMLSSAFISYGFYKLLRLFLCKNFLPNLFFSIFSGIYITTMGIMLLFVPKISLLWLIALIGVYFLLESISLKAFASQIRSMYGFWIYMLIASCFIYLIGLIIILGLPVMSFWVVTLLSGLCFVIKGMAKLSVWLVNRNNYI